MNTDNSASLDTNQVMNSTENGEPELNTLQRKTRENYNGSLPKMSKPVETIDDVPEEECKLTPRPIIAHTTPQIKVTPLEPNEMFNDAIPSSTPLKPSQLGEEEKQRAKSMMTLANGGIRNSKLMARRRQGLNLKLSVDCKFLTAS